MLLVRVLFAQLYKGLVHNIHYTPRIPQQSMQTRRACHWDLRAELENPSEPWNALLPQVLHKQYSSIISDDVHSGREQPLRKLCYHKLSIMVSYHTLCTGKESSDIPRHACRPYRDTERLQQLRRWHVDALPTDATTFVFGACLDPMPVRTRTDDLLPGWHLPTLPP